MDYSTWKHLNDNGYRPVEYIYKPDNFSNPDFGLGIIAYGNKYGLEVKMQASQEDMDYAMATHALQICGYRGLTRIDNLPYQNCCHIYIRQNSGYYLGRQLNAGWYTMPDGTIVDNSGAHPLITPCDTDIHIVSTYYDSESDEIKIFLDGVQKGSTGSKAWENDLTAGTEYFVYGYGDSRQESFKGRIYYIKTFDDERNVTGHFIPCVRKSDGRAGLYDVVNSVFKVSTYDYIKAGPYPGQRLPYDYKEVEYIKNLSTSGGIDTGMKMSITDYSVEAKFKQDEISDNMPLGTGRQDNGALWYYNYYSGGYNMFAVYANYISGWKVGKMLWQPCNTDIHTVKFEGHSTSCNISWDSGNIQTGTYTTPQQYSTDNLFVFGRRTNINCYLGRIYYVKLWNTETGTMLLDYVPCVRMSDNTPGFYDLVSDEFKTITDATTKWEVGPDIIIEQIPWAVGTGNIRLTYIGVGNGTIIAESDETNLYESRSQQITVETTRGGVIERAVTIVQEAKVRTDISTAIVTAENQTYSGSAKTPTPTVTLNGETIPSSGYDVTYSNNINAGTATITVTGKGEYTGTATGTFTIAKANPTYTAPTARTGLTYSGSSQYLVTAGSTYNGTIQYSNNGTTWSTTRPSSTNAGSYTTYWRLVGDSNHNDVASTSLSTTIAKASRTLSFTDSYAVIDINSNITKTATLSAGSGDGAITYSISNTTYATINSSSGKVTSKTSDGSAIVTATIAEGTNYLSASASYNLYVFATTHSFDYTGSYQEVELLAGQYKLQCWGAQGGSNAADSSYGITTKAGGKGGYSEGIITLSTKTTVRVYVGRAGSSSAGGFNGGGSTTGSSSYTTGTSGQAGYVYGTSRMGGGGGATDIRLSDGALLSRMIVAGGGSGGAMTYRKETTSTTTWEAFSSGSDSGSDEVWRDYHYKATFVTASPGPTYRAKITLKSTNNFRQMYVQWGILDGDSWTVKGSVDCSNNSYATFTISSDSNSIRLVVDGEHGVTTPADGFNYVIQKQVTTTTTNDYTDSQVGFAGGGTTGVGYSSIYQGKQNTAGSGGSFGQGANQTVTNYRHCSGAGGGGWYGGGGGSSSDSSTTNCKYSGGGSGFVNTAASAGNRPSGYTGLQLDSGETKAGNTSFPNTAGTGNETGHSGNGYAKITRLV